jgi:hypothetical protein
MCDPAGHQRVNGRERSLDCLPLERVTAPEVGVRLDDQPEDGRCDRPPPKVLV